MSRVPPPGSPGGGLRAPGTTSGRQGAPLGCSDDDFGHSGDDFEQLWRRNFVFLATLEMKIWSDGRFSITFGSERATL